MAGLPYVDIAAGRTRYRGHLLHFDVHAPGTALVADFNVYRANKRIIDASASAGADWRATDGVTRVFAEQFRRDSAAGAQRNLSTTDVCGTHVVVVARDRILIEAMVDAGYISFDRGRAVTALRAVRLSLTSESLSPTHSFLQHTVSYVPSR